MTDAFLYILSEDDNDDLFYEFCVEKITGHSFQVDSRRLRRGGGVGAVRKALKHLLQGIRHTGQVDNTFFIIALDNDRCQRHAHNHTTAMDQARAQNLSNNERNKQCRHCEIEREICAQFGVKPVWGEEDKWIIPGAIAVPVEMIESWLLMSTGRAGPEEALEMFGLKGQSITKRYYKPGTPPDQLKDLVAIERSALSLPKEDFYLYCAEELDPTALAAISPSFALFKAQVDTWNFI